MAGAPRDLATPELWQASLQRSLARRRAAKLMFVPPRSRAKRLALGSLVGLAAAPAAALADAGVASADAGVASAGVADAGAPRLSASESANAGHPVRLLQKLLHLKVDGVFGAATLAAVKAYQSQHGLEVDGIVGPMTWASLGYSDVKELSPPVSVPQRRVALLSRSHRRGRPSHRPVGDADAGSQSIRSVQTDGAVSAPRSTPRASSPSTAASSFALCVANHEAGSPGSTSATTVNWTIKDAPYEGGFQWLRSSWISQGGGRYAPRAAEATPAQQIAVFQAAEPSDPGAWPTSVPACGG